MLEYAAQARFFNGRQLERDEFRFGHIQRWRSNWLTKQLAHSAAETVSRIGRITCKTASVILRAALRSQYLSLAKNCSIGFKSGEYFGR
jgi:hypothetical protein